MVIVREKKEKIIRALGGVLQLYHVDRNGKAVDIRDLSVRVDGFDVNRKTGDVSFSAKVNLGNTDIGGDDKISCRVVSASAGKDGIIVCVCEAPQITKNGIKFLGGENTFEAAFSEFSFSTRDFSQLASILVPEVGAEIVRKNSEREASEEERLSEVNAKYAAKRKAEIENAERERAAMEKGAVKKVSDMILDGNHKKVVSTFRAAIQNGLSGKTTIRFANALIGAGLEIAEADFASGKIKEIADYINSK